MLGEGFKEKILTHVTKSGWTLLCLDDVKIVEADFILCVTLTSTRGFKIECETVVLLLINKYYVMLHTGSRCTV